MSVDMFAICVLLYRPLVPPQEGEGEGDTEVMDVHRLREDLTRLREINRKLYSLLAEKSSQNPTSSPQHD